MSLERDKSDPVDFQRLTFGGVDSGPESGVWSISALPKVRLHRRESGQSPNPRGESDVQAVEHRMLGEQYGNVVCGSKLRRGPESDFEGMDATGDCGEVRRQGVVRHWVDVEVAYKSDVHRPTASIDGRGNLEGSRHDRDQSVVFHHLTVTAGRTRTQTRRAEAGP